MDQYSQCIGGIAHLVIDGDDRLIFGNTRGEIFIVNDGKLFVKFFLSQEKFGNLVGIACTVWTTPTAGDVYEDPIVVSAHASGKICFWDFDYPNPVKVISLDSGFGTRAVHCLAIHDDLLVVGGEKGLVWIMSSTGIGEFFCVQTISEFGAVTCVAIGCVNGEGHKIFCLNKQGLVTILGKSDYGSRESKRSSKRSTISNE
jgi:WD40 repeat protein